jgi:two-component system, OmpR family, KDP operon response regulator KdpE
VPVKRVMVVDDDPHTRRLLRAGLVARGFEVCDARSGEEALAMLEAYSPEVILLDLNMPGLGGIATCRAIHESSEAAIIVVSVTQAPRSKVLALDAGADDYVTKPFDLEELIARIRAIERRSASGDARVFDLGEVMIDLNQREVRRGGETLHLTAKEFRLLDCLIAHSGQVVSHRKLLQEVWGPDYGAELEYLRVFINQLRRKIEPDPSHPKYILTELSAGYRFAGGSEQDLCRSLKGKASRKS